MKTLKWTGVDSLLSFFRQSRLFLITVFIITGCSFKFIYHQLDWLIPWYLDDFIPINSPQQLILDERLPRLLAWHRKDQLPLYADFLDKLADIGNRRLSDAELEEIYLQVRQFSENLLYTIMPDVIELLHSLDDQQVKYLFKKLAKENVTYRKKYLENSEAKQRQRRAQEVSQFIRRWAGSVDKKQVELIQQWSQTYQLMGEDFILSRQLWQQRLKEILLRRDDRVALEQSLLGLIKSQQVPRSTEYYEKFRFNQRLLKQFYIDLYTSLSQKQRDEVTRQIKKYADDFRYLASTG